MRADLITTGALGSHLRLLNLTCHSQGHSSLRHHLMPMHDDHDLLSFQPSHSFSPKVLTLWWPLSVSSSSFPDLMDPTANHLTHPQPLPAFLVFCSPLVWPHHGHQHQDSASSHLHSKPKDHRETITAPQREITALEFLDQKGPQ